MEVEVLEGSPLPSGKDIEKVCKDNRERVMRRRGDRRALWGDSVKRLAAGDGAGGAQVLKAEAEVSESKHGKGRSDGVPLGVIPAAVCCGADTANP